MAYSYFADSFNAAKLIKLVEQKPVLWNVYHASHSNKQLRSKAWESIARNFVRDWDRLTEKEKFGSLSEIKSKWKNIKDTFTKDQKRGKLKGTAKKRKYIHTDMLQFLSFTIPDNNLFFTEETETNQEGEEDELEGKIDNKDESVDGNFETDPDLNGSNLKDELTSSDCESSNEPLSTSTKNILFIDSATTDANFSGSSRPKDNDPFVSSSFSGVKRRSEDVSRSEDSDGDDPDRMFLLSMLPLFKNLSEHRKIVARIQLTQVLQKLLYPKKC